MEKPNGEKQIDPRYKIGMRNIKTALAVGICIAFFQLIGISDGIQAAIASIICMKSSLQNSLQTGIERVTGTVIGAVLGILSLLLIEQMTFQISTLLAITGVVLIIYLCNILKVQASTVIGLVVFLIILIGEKDVPPVYYGILRLIETVFGIAAAYLINRFFDPRHIRKLRKKQEASAPEIRVSTFNDLSQIMSIWLRSNLTSHPFIDALHWHNLYDSVRTRYRDTAKIYVYETGGEIAGFISILDDMVIDGLHVSEKKQNLQIEERLLNYCQEQFPCLVAKVYSGNEKLVEVLLKSGFNIVDETINENTDAEQYSMEWSNKA
ncbi:MAG: GNAT family N-acetyltransferase [Anaerovoracaceae bacterium]